LFVESKGEDEEEEGKKMMFKKRKIVASSNAFHFHEGYGNTIRSIKKIDCGKVSTIPLFDLSFIETVFGFFTVCCLLFFPKKQSWASSEQSAA